MEQIKQLLANYKSGTLSDAEQTVLEQFIADGKVQLEELDNFQEIDQYMDLADQLEPSRAMDAGFQRMLNGQRPAAKPTWALPSWLSSPWRFALPLALIVFAFWLGRGTIDPPNQTIVEATPDIATSLLNAENVSEKIHLVSSTKINDPTDKKIIDVLLFTLNNDASNNVRLACIDVLMNYSTLPAVREGLVNAINNQTSPIVLSNLAEAIATSGNQLEREDFQSRINKDLPPPIQKSMEDILTHL